MRFSRSNRSDSGISRRNPPRKRSLRFESLEYRQLLSISPAGGFWSMTFGEQHELGGNALNGAWHDEGKTLTIAVDSAPMNGGLYLSATGGDFVYHPNPGFVGVDEFTCLVQTSDRSESQIATVVVHVLPQLTAESEGTVASVDRLTGVFQDISTQSSISGSDVLAACLPDASPTEMMSPWGTGTFSINTSDDFVLQRFSEITDDERLGEGLMSVNRRTDSIEDESGNRTFTERVACNFSFATGDDHYFGEYIVRTESVFTDSVESFVVSTTMVISRSSISDDNSPSVVHSQSSRIITFHHDTISDVFSGHEIQTDGRRTGMFPEIGEQNTGLDYSTLFTVFRMNWLNDPALNAVIREQLGDENTLSSEWIQVGTRQTSGSEVAHSFTATLEAERPLTLQAFVTMQAMAARGAANSVENTTELPQQTVDTHRFNIDAIFQDGHWRSVETGTRSSESTLEYAVSGGVSETYTEIGTRSESYTHITVDDQLQVGEILHTGKSFQSRQSSHSGTYPISETSTTSGVTLTRTGTGKWSELSSYSYQDEYSYVESFWGYKWSLDRGESWTNVVDHSTFSEERSGEYTKIVPNGSGSNTIAGYWGESVSTVNEANRTVESTVTDGEWVDSGTELFLENGSSKTHTTIDDASYTRSVTGGTLTGKVGTFEEKSRIYKFEGTRALEGQTWVLSDGDGWEMTDQSSGPSYDGEGSYTITGSSGSGSTQKTWNIAGNIVESGRIGSGSGMYTEWTPSEGVWAATSVIPTHVNTEQVRFSDTSNGTYTDRGMTGTVAARNSEYSYDWKMHIGHDDTQNELFGKAIENSRFNLDNESNATGCLTESYYSGYLYVSGNLPYTHDDSDISHYEQESHIEFSLDKSTGTSPVYSWKYGSGTLTESFNRTVSTQRKTEGAQSLTPSYGSNISAMSVEYDKMDSWSYRTDERWEIVPGSSSLPVSNHDDRSDVWNPAKATRVETFHHKYSQTETSCGTGCSTYNGYQVTGTFDCSCTDGSGRTITTTTSYVPETNKWRSEYAGIGNESFGRTYHFNGLYSSCFPGSACVEIVSNESESFRTDRVLTYTKTATEWTATNRTISNGPTVGPSTGCYGSFPSPGIWDSYGWDVSGTGCGEISRTDMKLYGQQPKVWSGTQDGHGIIGTETNQNRSYYDYTFRFTEEKPVSSGSWRYTSVTDGGRGYSWANKEIVSENNAYQRNINQGLAALHGVNHYTESLVEGNYYKISFAVNASGQIVQEMDGTGVQTLSKKLQYNGSTGNVTSGGAGSTTTVNLTESGEVTSSSKRFVEWKYRNGTFSADAETKTDTSGSQNFSYKYEYSYQCNSYWSNTTNKWLENSSWSNEKTQNHTFSNATWSLLWADRYTSYSQSGCGCGNGTKTSESSCNGCGGQCTVSSNDAYDYTGSWVESCDPALGIQAYSLSGGITNQTSGSSGGCGCGSYERQTHYTGFYSPSAVPSYTFNYVNPRTTGSLYSSQCSSGCSGCGCGSGASGINISGYDTSVPVDATNSTSSTNTIGRLPGMSPISTWSTRANLGGYTGAFYGLSSIVPPSAIRMENLSGNYREPTAISSTAAHNAVFSEWKTWRERNRMNAEMSDVISFLANLQEPENPPITRPAKMHEPGIVAMDLYSGDQASGQSETMHLSSYMSWAGDLRLCAPTGDDALVDAELNGSTLVLSIADGATDGMTAVTIVGYDADGLPISWTVTIHVVAVTGYIVEEMSWGEQQWGRAPQNSGVNEDTDEHWSVLWRENNYRWLPKTTADGLIQSVAWYAVPVGSTNIGYSFVTAASGSSRDRWAYYGLPGDGEQMIAPVVTFGGTSIYHPNAINSTSVPMKRETELDENNVEHPVYTADQPRIAVTQVTDLEWEEVEWSRTLEIEEYNTSTGVAKLTFSWNDGYLAYPDYQHHNDIPQPIEHTTVRVLAQLGAAIPVGMVGKLHLEWYDPDNVFANTSTASNVDHGRRDNADGVALSAVGGRLPGWTLEFTTADVTPNSDSFQKSYLYITKARYGDNFIVAAHPNIDVVEKYEFQDGALKYQNFTGAWIALPNSASYDLTTSTLTIMPSVDIDTDSDNNGLIERNDREEWVEYHPEHSGKFVPWNNNDDNDDGIPDYLEKDANGIPTIFDSDDHDIVKVILDVGFKNYEGLSGCYFRLICSDGVRIWKDQKRNMLDGFTYSSSGNATNFTWMITNSVADIPEKIYVEVVGGYSNTVAWELVDTLDRIIDVDTINITGLFVDLDADTDHEGPIDRSTNEEYLEDHDYALGRLIVPNTGDSDNDGILDCWDGYYYPASGPTQGLHDQRNPMGGGTTRFVPFILEIPSGVPLTDIFVTFEYNDCSTMRPLGFADWSKPPQGLLNGYARIWLKDGTTRDGRPVENDGQFVRRDVKYTAAQLGFTDTIRTIMIYVEGITTNINSHTYEEINAVGRKPETAITVKMEIDGIDMVFSDKVKYVISETDGFYYQLVHHPELRSALAAQGIYEREDLKRFCMEPLNAGNMPLSIKNAFNVNFRMRDLDNPNDPQGRGVNGVDMLLNGDKQSGFDAGIYHDYISGRNVLVFRGSDDKLDLSTLWDQLRNEHGDWYTNYQQALGKNPEQYQIAANLGKILKENKEPDENRFADTMATPNRWKISGHSLGGGLASAASVVSEVYCHTFNAAGLHLNSVKEIFKPIILTKASMDRIANDHMTAYYVDWDVLHFIQASGNIIIRGFTNDFPIAAGVHHELVSDFGIGVALRGIQLVLGFLEFAVSGPGGTLTVLDAAGGIAKVMGEAHSCYVETLLRSYRS